MIPWKKFIGLSLQVYKCSKECAKFNGGMTNWKPVVRMIVNQDSGFIYEFFSTSRIQLLLMSMSIRKRTLMQKLVYSISKSSAPNRWQTNSSRKRKITAEEPHLTVEIRHTLKEPDHIVPFTEKLQRCQYCFTNRKRDIKCFTYCKSCNVSLCVQKDRNSFFLRAIVQSHDMLMNFWTFRYYYFLTCFSYNKVSISNKSSIFLTKTYLFLSRLPVTLYFSND